MFQKIRLQLAAVNAVVLLAILLVSGIALYVYMDHRLMQQIDQSLILTAKPLPKSGRLANLPISIGRAADRQIAYLIWSEEGELIASMPENALYQEDEPAFRRHLEKSGLQTVQWADHTYRTLTVPVNRALLLRAPQGDYVIGSIQLVRNIDSETEILNRLLMFLVIGGLAGAGVTVGAGFFLAGRSLVPIRNAWDKQQRFVADASHELRTPLAVIQSHGELMLRHPDRTVQEESPHLSVILQESRRLNKLVSDLLTLARSDSNQVELERKPLLLSGLLHELADQFRQLAELKQVTVRTEIEEIGEWSGDEARLRQLFVILLDNALKYTPDNGTITIRCRRRHQIQVEVIDTGIGIAEEDLPYVFDRFYRGDKSRTRGAGGTGLGLSIAKWIAEKHRGRIEIDSRQGTGTTVRISFAL